VGLERLDDDGGGRPRAEVSRQVPAPLGPGGDLRASRRGGRLLLARADVAAFVVPVARPRHRAGKQHAARTAAREERTRRLLAEHM